MSQTNLRVALLCYALDVPSQTTSFNQSEWLISESRSCLFASVPGFKNGLFWICHFTFTCADKRRQQNVWSHFPWRGILKYFRFLPNPISSQILFAHQGWSLVSKAAASLIHSYSSLSSLSLSLSLDVSFNTILGIHSEAEIPTYLPTFLWHLQHTVNATIFFSFIVKWATATTFLDSSILYKNDEVLTYRYLPIFTYTSLVY